MVVSLCKHNYFVLINQFMFLQQCCVSSTRTSNSQSIVINHEKNSQKSSLTKWPNSILASIMLQIDQSDWITKILDTIQQLATSFDFLRALHIISSISNENRVGLEGPILFELTSHIFPFYVADQKRKNYLYLCKDIHVKSIFAGLRVLDLGIR